MTYHLTLDPDLTEDAVAYNDALASAVARLSADLANGDLHALSIAGETADLIQLQDHATRILSDASEVFVLGMGGSSLAGRALVALRNDAPGDVAIRFLNNIDPRTWNSTFSARDLARTQFLVISKSGGTAETIAQCLLTLEMVTVAGRRPRDCITVVIQPGPSPLRTIAEQHGLPALEHPAGIGGRFAALSLVGLLPAMLAGLDAGAIRRGARFVLDDVAKLGVESAPARGARVIASHERNQVGVQALLSYGDVLRPLTRWWVQLWGESLGKDGQGSTPLATVGVTDQHSQLQLWRDGTHRHMVTVLATTLPVDTGVMTTGDPDLAYLNGRTMGELFHAEREATCETLVDAGVPLRRFDIERVDEETMGALFAHFMIETILVADLMGVDPFGQPAVEDGKQRARDNLKAM
ncbi:MAG: glucose-6-phosphate isomerase [Alphaproteobacteria bacterium]|jgi:glucose-6-phosphate isomerase